MDEKTGNLLQSLLAKHIHVGDIVDYSEVIGEPPTRFDLRVRAEPGPIGNGDWVVLLEGVVGWVSIMAVRPASTSPVRPEFSVHMLTPEELRVAEEISRAFSVLLNKLDRVPGTSASRTRVATLLQEACFWAKRGFAESAARE